MFKKVSLKEEKQLEEKKPEQRKAIVTSKCKIGGKCCTLTIDGGSTKNLISLEVIWKLQVRCTLHLNAYKVSWL